MKFLKIVYYLNAYLKMIFFKLIYGKKVHFGKGFTFRKRFSLAVDKTGRLYIGDNCFFNNDVSVSVLNKVYIGSGVLLGEGVKIYDHNHRFKDVNSSIKSQGFSVGTVKIGNHCWLGSNVVILKGADIGDNCVIGAGCVISGRVEPGTVVKPAQNYTFEKLK